MQRARYSKDNPVEEQSRGFALADIKNLQACRFDKKINRPVKQHSPEKWTLWPMI